VRVFIANFKDLKARCDKCWSSGLNGPRNGSAAFCVVKSNFEMSAAERKSENATLDAPESKVIGRIDLVAPRAIYIWLGYMIRGQEI
jgi:hypothetical protein